MDLYTPNYMKNPSMQTAMNMATATSGKTLPKSFLNSIINQELNTAYNNMYRSKEMTLREQQQAEQQRQFNENLALKQEQESNAAKQGWAGLGSNLLGLKLGYDYMDKRLGLGNTGATGTTPVSVAKSIGDNAKTAVGKVKNFFGSPSADTTGYTSSYNIDPFEIDQSGATSGIVGEASSGYSPLDTGFNYWPAVGGALAGTAVGQSGTGRDVGQFLLGQHGGESEHGAVSGGLTGAATGFLTSGGNPWAALLGGLGGAVGGSDLFG